MIKIYVYIQAEAEALDPDPTPTQNHLSLVVAELLLAQAPAGSCVTNPTAANTTSEFPAQILGS